MRASKHILPPNSTPRRDGVLRRRATRGRASWAAGGTVARVVAVTALALFAAGLVSQSLIAGAQEASNGPSPETSAGSDLATADVGLSGVSLVDLSLDEIRDLYLEDQLANDYILGQHREDKEAIDEAAASLHQEIRTLAQDAAVIEERLAELDRSILGQETVLVQIAWERDQLLLQRAALIEAMIATAEGIEHLRSLLTERAVAAYMVPTDGYKGEMINANDFVELEKKLVLIRSVAESDDAVLRLLQVEEQLLLRQQAEIDRLALEATDRLVDEERSVKALDRNRAEFEALETVLQAEIAAHTDEVLALEAEKDALRSIIEQREQRFLAEAADRAQARLGCAEDAKQAEQAGGEPVDCAHLDEALPPTSVRWPSNGTVSSMFGLRWGRAHEGIDMAAPSGDPVMAAEDGEVYFAGRLGNYGLTVLIDHGGGMHTLYAHQRELHVGEGDTVLRGETIGLIGSTGRSTGPHLHFEIQLDGEPVDPMLFLPST